MIPYEMVTYFKTLLQKFIRHNFIARWQDEQIQISNVQLELANSNSIILTDMPNQYAPHGT